MRFLLHHLIEIRFLENKISSAFKMKASSQVIRAYKVRLPMKIEQERC